MRGIDLQIQKLSQRLGLSQKLALADISRKVMLAGVIGSSLLVGGCGSRLQQFTGSISDFGRGNSSQSSGDPLSDLAKRYDARPGDKRISLEYAVALRANGQHPQAVAVLQRASIGNVGDHEVAAAYGKALADIGRFEEATQVLSTAHSEDRPNWRVLSTLGSISDQMNNHARARDFYHRALQIAPNEPSILNNLGLSYVLTKELVLAETTLRKAASQPGADQRVHANLALALKLQGRSAGENSAAAAAPVAAPPVGPVGPSATRGRTASVSGSLWKAPPAAPHLLSKAADKPAEKPAE
jgi:Flp pilus assembly protein TadD